MDDDVKRDVQNDQDETNEQVSEVTHQALGLRHIEEKSLKFPPKEDKQSHQWMCNSLQADLRPRQGVGSCFMASSPVLSSPWLIKCS